MATTKKNTPRESTIKKTSPRQPPRKQMAPLPEDSYQRPPGKQHVAGGAARSNPDGIEVTVKRQRALAKEKARAIRARIPKRSREEILSSLMTSATEMHATTQETSAAGAELEGTMSEIMASAQQATAATAQSAAGVAQIRVGAQTFKDRSALSFERADRLVALLNETVAGMQELIVGIKAAAEVNRASGEAVAEVDRMGREVLEQAQAALTMADQINLFAFNAALAASRAGKHGTGFSIVSDEVRTLAQKSVQAATQIDTAVQGVLAAVSQVVKDMDRSIADSTSRAEEADRVVVVMNRSTRAVAEMAEAGRTIDQLAGELTEALLRTEANSETIQAATASVASGATEATSVLREQSSALAGIQATARELSVKSEEIKGQLEDGVQIEELGTIADEMAATVEQTASSAIQISSAVQQIAAGAETLAEQSEDNLPFIQRAVEILEEIRSRATTSARQTDELAGLLGDTTVELEGVIANVSLASARNQEYSTNIRTLAQELGGIEESIDVLLNIGIMTNLLAVSGRIEGARAGEVGQTFIPVSEDIRQLADEANANVVRTRRVLRSIQAAVVAVADDLDRSGQAVRGEAEKARKTSARLASVDAEMQTISVGSREIIKAVDESVAAVPQVQTGITQVAQAAVEAAAAARQASSASNEQGKAMRELASTVDDLALQVTLLRS